MPRKVKIAATALATLEDTAPPFNLRYPEPADNLRLGLAMLEAAGRQNADIAVLPEGFLAAGVPAKRLRSVAEPLSGSSMTAIADCARRHSMYFVAGLHVLEDGLLFKIAVLIDRSGKIIGKCAKKHATEGEIEGGVIPGGAVPVFETDFGRLGLSICFDVNWPSLLGRTEKTGCGTGMLAISIRGWATVASVRLAAPVRHRDIGVGISCASDPTNRQNRCPDFALESVGDLRHRSR
jgi:predicted amidohydrolase